LPGHQPCRPGERIVGVQFLQGLVLSAALAASGADYQLASGLAVQLLAAASYRQPGIPDFFARRADGTGVEIDVRPDDRIGDRDAAVFAATAQVHNHPGAMRCPG
jgi:hypothetical protein